MEYSNNFFLILFFRQRFIDICDGKVNRGGITVMKDISSVKKNQEATSNERIVNKIQDILWDDVFEQYFLHRKVIIFSMIQTLKTIGAILRLKYLKFLKL